MIFSYSGATAKGQTQLDPNFSLGGYIGSPIPNSLLNNIFSEASQMTLRLNKRETKLIVLTNNDPSLTAKSLSFGFNVNSSCIANYQIAFVTPNSAGCFEQITDSGALPYNATFQAIVPGSTINIPTTLAPGQSLGIWLSRTFNFSSADLAPKNIDYWKNILETYVENGLPIPSPDTQDELDLILNYNLQ